MIAAPAAGFGQQRQHVGQVQEAARGAVGGDAGAKLREPGVRLPGFQQMVATEHAAERLPEGEAVLACERDQLARERFEGRGLAAQLVEHAGMVQGVGQRHAVRQLARPGEAGMRPRPRLLEMAHQRQAVREEEGAHHVRIGRVQGRERAVAGRLVGGEHRFGMAARLRKIAEEEPGVGERAVRDQPRPAIAPLTGARSPASCSIASATASASAISARAVRKIQRPNSAGKRRASSPSSSHSCCARA